ncbi:MAG: tRNA lysidine(34) synthetase TilS [Porticoccaceae bacterium]|nr:MAG: tRNA lysidine(34) synthetase TilS [Porticoccaceae bacterium]
MSFDPDYLAAHLPKLREAGHCYVGYSGGLDSHVLLHALVSLLGSESFTAVHINHQLSPNAESWQQHCQACCDALGVPMMSESVTVENSGQGMEQAAREARYTVFEKVLNESDLMLLAHHADDQVETVLYRLLRGSGTKGLAGIPMNRSLGVGEILRPLLPYTRIQLEAYAATQGLQWIEDESNQDTTFDRNFLRQKVVPILAERWPDYAARVTHSAALCAETDQLAEILAAQDLAAVYERAERIGWSVALEPLMALDVSRQANLLRHWAGQHQLPLPGHRIIETVLHELLPARQDAEPLVTWGSVQLRRYQKHLHLLPLDIDIFNESSEALNNELEWDVKSDLLLPDGSELLISVEQGKGLKIPEGHGATIRFRSGGERCKPAGRNGSNTLKKLFQEYGLEPWLRNRVPLIYIQGQLAAVGDLWVCDEFAVEEGEQGIVLQWSFPS